MKRMNIEPFREFWLDCFNCIVYSLTEFSQDVPKLYYYNNMYRYNYTEETVKENGIKYRSLVPWTDNFRLLDELTHNLEKKKLAECENPIQYVKEKIDEGKIVLLAIDLFHWIKEGLHYMNNHIIHMSLVIGYDDDAEQLIVFETGDEGYLEHRVDYEQAEKAIKAAHISTRVSEINPVVKVKMYNKENLAFYAKQIIESIDEKIENAHDIWKVEGLSDEGLNEVLSIIQTHIYSMQNRAYINAYMFENAFENDLVEGVSLHEKFHKMEKDYERLKGVCIRLMYRRNKYQEIMKVKEKMMNMLEVESGLWKHYIKHFDKLCMK